MAYVTLKKAKLFILIGVFLIGGCFSSRKEAVKRDLLLRDRRPESDRRVKKVSSDEYMPKTRGAKIDYYMDAIEASPPLTVDIIYARDLKSRGYDVGEYRLEPEDVVDISVWQIEKLNRKSVVRPDGRISYPLIGDVMAEGRTVEELRKDITDKLTRYIRNPQVTVIIERFGGKRLAVINEDGGGKVLRFTRPIKVLEALAQAGGYNTDLNLKKIYVIREFKDRPDYAQLIVVNAQNLLRQGDIRENIYVRSGDTMFLARGMLATVEVFRREIDKLVGDIDFTYGPLINSRTTTGPDFQPFGNNNN